VDLKPGASLGEIETAERVGVSRTPVREAFARLAAEGLVVTSGRTVRVAPLSRQHVIEYYELREALETASVRLAAKRRDPVRFDAIIRELRASLEGLEELDPNRLYLLASELDAAIEEAAASRYISSALDDLGGQMARVRHYSRSDGERLARAAEEHIVIAEAILAGDELLGQCDDRASAKQPRHGSAVASRRLTPDAGRIQRSGSADPGSSAKARICRFAKSLRACKCIH
jgi:DNA-binding GntR family transcriptional regulator